MKRTQAKNRMAFPSHPIDTPAPARTVTFTQREAAKAMVAELPDLDTTELHELVGRTQNSIQYGGEGDGSIEPDLWTLLRDIDWQASTYRLLLARARHLLTPHVADAEDVRSHG